MLLEESLLFHVMFSGSMLKNWARMDLPGVDLLGAMPYHTMGGWNGNVVPVPEDFSCKMASSVTHLLGKQGTFTESFALADNATLRQVLGVTAWQFAGGITHMSTYSIQQALSAEDYAALQRLRGPTRLPRSPRATRGRRGGAGPGTFRVGDLHAARRRRLPTLLDRNPEPIAIDRVFRDTCHELLQNQRDFDCLSEELLAAGHGARRAIALGRGVVCHAGSARDAYDQPRHAGPEYRTLLAVGRERGLHRDACRARVRIAVTISA